MYDPEIKRSLEVLGILFLSVFMAEGPTRCTAPSLREISEQAVKIQANLPRSGSILRRAVGHALDPAGLSLGLGAGQGQLQTPWFCPKHTPDEEHSPLLGVAPMLASVIYLPSHQYCIAILLCATHRGLGDGVTSQGTNTQPSLD